MMLQRCCKNVAMSTLWCSHEVSSLSISINSLYLSLEHLQSKGLSNVWHASSVNQGSLRAKLLHFLERHLSDNPKNLNDLWDGDFTRWSWDVNFDHILTLFRMDFFGNGHGGGRAKRPTLPKVFHTYPTMMKCGTVIPYLRKIQEIYESRDTPLEFCWHQ